MNAQEIIAAIIKEGATDSQSILDALCDGAALAAIGITDDDQKVLEYIEFADGVAVLFSPVFGYAYINQRSPGVGDSMLVESGGADSADHAARIWRGANVSA